MTTKAKKIKTPSKAATPKVAPLEEKATPEAKMLRNLEAEFAGTTAHHVEGVGWWPEPYADELLFNEFSGAVLVCEEIDIQRFETWVRCERNCSGFTHADMQAKDDEIRRYRAEISDLAGELSDAFTQIQHLLKKPECRADAKALVFLLSIDNGGLVQDLYEAAQSMLFDMAARRDPSKKWLIATKVVLVLDKEDHNRVMAVSETKAASPPAEAGGCIYIDTDGRIVTPAEAVEQLALFAGHDGTTN